MLHFWRGTSFLALWATLSVTAFAGSITNVVETGGDNEATDTITAKWTGTSWPVSVAGEPIPSAVIGDNYTVGTFGHYAPALVDRAHRYADDPASNLPIPGYLVGAEYIMSGNDNRDNASYRLDVTVSTPVTAYLLIDNRLSDTNAADPPTFDATHMQWVVDNGWTATSHGLNRAGLISTPDEVAFDESADGTINQYFSVYQKSFGAGTFSLFQADNAGQNMYGVAVIGVPEPSSIVLSGLSLMGLLAGARRRR